MHLGPKEPQLEREVNKVVSNFDDEINQLHSEYLEKEAYSDPELRAKIKNKLMAGDKGGKSGEWSARKSQMLVLEYEKAGGKYLGPKTDSAKSLTKWSKEDWKTIDGKNAVKNNGKTARYLPAEVWDKLTENEKQATNQKKLNGTGQYVPNTKKSRQ